MAGYLCYSEADSSGFESETAHRGRTDGFLMEAVSCLG